MAIESMSLPRYYPPSNTRIVALYPNRGAILYYPRLVQDENQDVFKSRTRSSREIVFPLRICDISDYGFRDGQNDALAQYYSCVVHHLTELLGKQSLLIVCS